MDREELNATRKEELQKIIKPIEEFINKYCCPHDIIVITQGSAKIFSGEVVIPLKLLD